MKKIIILAICLILLSMPLTVAYPNISTLNRTTNLLNPMEKSVYNETNPPDWAEGNFSGVWGLNLLGMPLEPAGWMKGYYSQKFIFRMEGIYGNNNESFPRNNIATWAFGPFLIGGAQNITTQNGTFIAGLGGVNETNHYYWRLSAIIGPSFYMYGTFTKFEE